MKPKILGFFWTIHPSCLKKGKVGDDHPNGCPMGANSDFFLDQSGKTTYGDGSKPWYLVNPKIAGKWMFIPLKMYL
jgi:hypothetical protein